VTTFICQREKHVAECLGLLTSMPGMAADVIPTLLTLAQPVAGQRVGGRIVANTLKVALAKPQSPAAEPLTAIIDQFLPLCEFIYTYTTLLSSCRLTRCDRKIIKFNILTV